MDKRKKSYKKYKFVKEIVLSKECLCAVILGAIVGLSLGHYYWKQLNTPKTLLGPVKQTVEVKVQEVLASETPCTFDPITYIRCSGEKLGKSNKDIMTLIRIMKCESGGRPDALNKNKNGTFDVGVLQINDVHSKRISRADRMDFVKNIDFGWKLHTEQGGFQAWSCYKKVK
jgi:hypothetical protein